MQEPETHQRDNHAKELAPERIRRHKGIHDLPSAPAQRHHQLNPYWGHVKMGLNRLLLQLADLPADAPVMPVLEGSALQKNLHLAQMTQHFLTKVRSNLSPQRCLEVGEWMMRQQPEEAAMHAIAMRRHQRIQAEAAMQQTNASGNKTSKFDPAAAPPPVGSGEWLVMDEHHYNVLISACNAKDDWKTALQLVQHMMEVTNPRIMTMPVCDDVLGMAPTVTTLNALLAPLAKNQKFNLAMDSYNKLLDVGVVPNEVALTRMIAVAASLGQWEKSIGYYRQVEKMTVGGTLEERKENPPQREPTVHALQHYQIAGVSLISVLGKQKQLKLALDVFRDQLVAHKNMSEVMVNTVLNACAISSDWETAEWIYSQMKESGVISTRASMNILIKANGNAGRSRAARNWFRTMKETGGRYAPDLSTLNHLLAAHKAAGEWDMAEEYLRDWQQEQLKRGNDKPFNPVTVQSMIQVCAEAGRMDKACDLYEEMTTVHGIPESVFLYNELMNGHNINKEWRKTVEVWDQLKRSPHNPTIQSYNAVMRAYGRLKQPVQAELAFHEMRAAGISPDRRCVNTLMFAVGSLDAVSGILAGRPSRKFELELKGQHPLPFTENEEEAEERMAHFKHAKHAFENAQTKKKERMLHRDDHEQVVESDELLNFDDEGSDVFEMEETDVDMDRISQRSRRGAHEERSRRR